MMTMKKTNINKSCDGYSEDIDFSKNVVVRNKEIEIPKVYTIYFFHDFDDSIKYRSYFEVFEKAKAEDEIIIYFDSPGGYVSTLNMFLNAIKDCKCKNITARVNYAASAAAIMTLACPNIILNHCSTLMLHTASMYGLDGKTQELESTLDHYIENYRRMFIPYLKRIMSDQEIEEMFNGKDFRFNELEVIKRLKKYSKRK